MDTYSFSLGLDAETLKLRKLIDATYNVTDNSHSIHQALRMTKDIVNYLDQGFLVLFVKPHVAGRSHVYHPQGLTMPRRSATTEHYTYAEDRHRELLDLAYLLGVATIADVFYSAIRTRLDVLYTCASQRAVLIARTFVSGQIIDEPLFGLTT